MRRSGNVRLKGIVTLGIPRRGSPSFVTAPVGTAPIKSLPAAPTYDMVMLWWLPRACCTATLNSNLYGNVRVGAIACATTVYGELGPMTVCAGGGVRQPGSVTGNCTKNPEHGVPGPPVGPVVAGEKGPSVDEAAFAAVS